MSFPIKAVCEVGPKGQKCHGKPEGEGCCTGVVTFEQTSEEECTITWDIVNAGKAGNHGFHIHEKADFSNGCMSAGPHYNPHGVDHGAPDAQVRHVGDLGNIIVDDAGNSKGSMVDTYVKLAGGFTVIGRSVMIHEDEDDLGLGDNSKAAEPGPPTNGCVSKKTGNAGARIACGEIVAA